MVVTFCGSDLDAQDTREVTKVKPAKGSAGVLLLPLLSVWGGGSCGCASEDGVVSAASAAAAAAATAGGRGGGGTCFL